MPLATLIPTADTSSLSLLAILSLGFFLGMRHATDADHVVAVSTIVPRERRLTSAALIGALWGAGHTLTIVAVGAGLLLFTFVIPPRLGLSMELSVGLMLIALGAFNLRSLRSSLRTITAEATDPTTTQSTTKAHAHPTADAAIARLDRTLGRWSLYQWLRPLAVGLVHGLAGSAAIALLVLATLHNTRWAVAYLLVFGVGTIAGMMLITLAIASALHYIGSRWSSLNGHLAVATGILSIAFGFFVVYQMGFVHGLFTTHPTWTPQ